MISLVFRNRLGWPVLIAIVAAATIPAVAQDPLRLSLKQAVEQALSQEGNAAVRVAEEDVRQAEAGSRIARSALLPHLDATIAEQNQTRNLEALGLRPQGLFRPPMLVGPFTTFDARANLSQTVFDLSQIRGFQASRYSLQAAQVRGERSRDLVAGRVAGLYIEALRAKAAVEAAQADVQLAEQLLESVVRQRAAGSGTRVEETRASVQLANEQQRLLSLQFESRRSLLELLRDIGLDLTRRVELSDTLDQPETYQIDFADATRRAFQFRKDLQAQLKAESVAERLSSAARSERLPSVSAFANYGSIGSSPGDSIPTWAAGVWVRIPLFQGGRLAASRHHALSRLRSEQIKTVDLRRQIEFEVRLALSGVELAREQIVVAEKGLELAREELARARRRYRAGFTNSLEVTGAQTRLERARENRISALFQFHQARINLSQPLGTVRNDLQ